MPEKNTQQNNQKRNTKMTFIIYAILGVLVILYFSLHHHEGRNLGQIFGIILGAGIVLVAAVSLFFETRGAKKDDSL